MPKFVIYEVYTRARIVEAETASQALQNHPPERLPSELNLCNWHAVPCDAEPTGDYEDFHKD